MRKKNYLKLIEYQTEQSRQHLGEVQGIYQEMRGYKHDFHHHLQTLKGQLESGETERALAYLEQLHGGWCKFNSEDGAFSSEFLVPAQE